MKRTIIASALVLGLCSVGCEEEKKADETATKDETKDEKKDAEKKDEGEDEKDAEKKDEGEASGALAHLSDDCKGVARIDIEALLAHDVIEEHLVPALEKIKDGEAKDDKAKRLQGFLKDSGIDPVEDLDELAICVVSLEESAPGDPPVFYVVLGGDFEKGKVLPALKKNAKPDKEWDEVKVAGIDVVKEKDEDEGYIGQLDSGAIAIGLNEAAFEMSTKTSDAAKEKFSVPMDKAISIVLPPEATAELFEKMFEGKKNPFEDHTEKVGRAAIVFDAGDNSLAVHLKMPDDDSAKEFGGVLRTFLKEMASQPSRPGSPMAMFGKQLEEPKIEYDDTTVVVKLEAPEDALEGFAKQAAEGIQESF